MGNVPRSPKPICNSPTDRQLEHARVGAGDHSLAGMQSEAADAKKIGEPHNRREHAADQGGGQRDVTASSPTRVRLMVEFDREIGRRRALERIHAGSDDKAGIEQTVRQ